MSDPDVVAAPLPLLECTDARIDALAHGGRSGVLIERLNFTASGPLVALMGDWGPLFALLQGDAVVATGSVTVLGSDAREQVRRVVAGVAKRDLPVPPEWTISDYLEASARLCGASRRSARAEVSRVIAELDLGSLAARQLGRALPAERRAMLIAHAALWQPDVLFVERPLEALDEHAARWVAAVLERASDGRQLVLSVAPASEVGVERAFVDRASDAFELERGALVAGIRSEAISRYLITATRNAEPLANALRDRGVVVEPADYGSGPTGYRQRWLVVLPDGFDTSELVELALMTDAPLLELRPIASTSAAAGPPRSTAAGRV